MGYVLIAQERLQNTLLFGKSDAEKLLNAYAEPGFRAAMFGLAEGWNGSARPIHTGKFNYQISITGGFSNNLSTDLNSLGLQVGKVKSNSPSTATIMGSAGGVLILPEGRSERELNLLNGSNLPAIPMIVSQGNFGFIRNTEISVRGGLIPLQESLIWTTGLGFKHEIKQWIPSIALANFDLAVFGNYSVISFDYKLDIDNLTNNPDNQFWRFKGNTAAWGIIASKKLVLLTLSTGLQYTQSKGNMRLDGTYLVGSFPNEPTTMDNPINRDFSGNRFSFILAGRLSLGFLSAQITSNVSKNSTVSFSLIFGRVSRR
ncbi:MAG: hypothetical protein OHK0045_11700 [Raineya sp.]